jgi:hypothetical protein
MDARIKSGHGDRNQTALQQNKRLRPLHGSNRSHFGSFRSYFLL